MSVSEGETIYPESEVSEDESSNNTSDEDFINDVETSEEESLPPKRKRKRIEINIKI